jgi:hypothetical protein
MNTRRPAREQKLPESEVDYLATIRNDKLHVRCSDLYGAGWTLRSIGEAMQPPRTRSTIKAWVDQVLPHNHAVWPDLPRPTYLTDATYVPRRPASPGIGAADLMKIQELQPVAKRFRSGMSPHHKAAIANDELTVIVETLHKAGVPVGELASAAGVTYRAMAKRLGRTK